MMLKDLILIIITGATCVLTGTSSSQYPMELNEKQSSYPQQTPTKQLLKALGLTEPGVRRWHSNPPQFMVDLYKSVADSSGITRFPGPYGANVVRAFSQREGRVGSSITFIVSGLQEKEDILEAELHVFLSKLQKSHRHSLQDNNYMLQVSGEVGGLESVLEMQEVASHSSGWRVIRVGRWLKSNFQNIMTGDCFSPSSLCDNDTSESSRYTSIIFHVTAVIANGEVLSINLHHRPRDARRPFLVLFNTSPQHLRVSSSETLTSSPHQELRKYSGIPTLKRMRRSVVEPTSIVAPLIPSGCERRDMMVDFASIGWSSWIVSPSSYNAFQCLGECSYPLDQNLNPTNHATVQSIINHSGSFPRVQRPCCVPSAYSNLSLLYYDAEGNVVLKQYDQMIATECGCH
ncbi:hypothetical protein SK128_016553 [Halocaridina rubra]|uniref:TGF-beta family profile domain-containing protein n=1 Tax=Halocaridina rubra TaxID=373956 RepID=A0AAN8X2J8_HALRR